MKKSSRLFCDMALVSGDAEWSIGSGRLTAKGEVELLRLFGAKLRESYAQLIEEPLHDPMTALLDKFDAIKTKQE